MSPLTAVKTRFRPRRVSYETDSSVATTFGDSPWLRRASQAALFSALLAAIAVILSVWHFFITAEGYIDHVEGLVLFHQTQAAAGLNVYDPVFRNKPPFSIPPYGPVFYYLVGAILPRQPSLLPGRLISILSLLGTSGLSWWFLRRRCGMGALLASVGAVVWLVLFGPYMFGANNRTDSLAIFFGLTALLAAAAFPKAGWQAAIPLLLLSGFTKPTAAVAPAVAIFLTLVAGKRPKEAICLGLSVSLCALGILAAGDWLSEGNFSRSLIYSNANGMSLANIVGITRGCCRQLLLPVGILLGGFLLRDSTSRIFGLHAIVSFGLAVLGTANIGAHVNYFMEPSWAAGFCLALCLNRVAKKPMYPLGLSLAAAIILQSAVLYATNVVYYYEKMDAWPILVQRTRTYGARGPILTSEGGVQVLLGQEPFVVDPHTVKRLSEAGKLNIDAMLRSLRQQEFVAVIAEDDIFPDRRPVHWPNEVRNLVATHYQPRERIGDVTLYVPRSKPLGAPGLAPR